MRVEQFRLSSGKWFDYRGWLWCNIPDDERRIVYRTDDPAMSYDAIQYHADGWYIISYNADGTSFDAVGTYDTIEDAERVYIETQRDICPAQAIDKCERCNGSGAINR